jgi:hypothetical protein
MTLDLRNVEYENLIERIFREEPRAANSILINFNEPDVNLFFRILCDFLTKGLLIIMGKEPVLRPGAINLNEVNGEHMTLLDNYFKSIGIGLEMTIIEVEDIKNHMKGLIEMEPEKLVKLVPYNEIESERIRDFNFIIKGDNRWIIINFIV